LEQNPKFPLGGNEFARKPRPISRQINGHDPCLKTNRTYMQLTVHQLRSGTISLIVLACAVSAGAQSPRQPNRSTSPENSSGGTIRGKIVLPSGGFVTQSIRISLQTVRGIDSTVFTDNTGTFEFTRLTPGRYQVVVDADPRLYETSAESIELVRGMVAVLNIALKEKGKTGQPKAGTVSAAELDSNVPPKARKEFDRASEASKNGKTEEAITHLRNAIAIYPQYLMAHNDLGAQLLELNRLDEAEKELRLALDIDPAAFNPTLNLGIVLIKKHEIQSALTVLEKATSMQSQSPAARFFYGMALSGASESERAEKEFIAAYTLGGSQYAEALFYLGRLYMDRGDRNVAKKYLERYLREAPNASNSAEARKLVAMLE
jgi:Flp pilus assembly protein TadD